MGSSLKHPITDIKFEQLRTRPELAISASLQGWRPYMQDFCFMHQIGQELLLAGVLDGHGGPEVACFASRVFYQVLQNDPFFGLKNFYRGLVNTFKRVDEMIISEQGENQLRKIQKQFNSDTSRNKACLGEEVGTTANILLLTSTKIYAANVGDSRSVLCRNGKAVNLSSDHKPDNPAQRDRIVKAGGHVQRGRINGSLNVSRTLGDFYFKANKKKSYSEQMVISIPEIVQLERDEKEDQYIVIASDGVWEKFGASCQSLIDSLNEVMVRADNWREALKQFLLRLVPETLVENSTGYDNMTMILVLLNVSRLSSASERNQ